MQDMAEHTVMMAVAVAMVVVAVMVVMMAMVAVTMMAMPVVVVPVICVTVMSVSVMMMPVPCRSLRGCKRYSREHQGRGNDQFLEHNPGSLG
jgi:fatty acid desaturase